MREMDSLGLKACSYQAALFEASAEETACSSAVFIRRFMMSRLAERMDHAGMLIDSTGITDAIRELEDEYGASAYGTVKYSAEELHWIGFIYRYWAYISGLSSRKVYRKIKPAQLRKLYFPFHSLDPYQAIERIAEGYGIEIGEDLQNISRGVAVLRRIRNKRAGRDGRMS